MEENKPNKTNSGQYQLFAFKMLGDFGASIAIPVVVFVLIGQYIDEKYSKSPLFTILGFVLAALSSAKIIYRKAKIYGEEYKKMNDAGKKQTE
ncbi:MAG TPA: AtpZ/AtpI family protein [Candidatus Udaeobacter sp.]|nr:AtpZ/AtpI family protein [Candidatus Udaeobacter sp.]